MDKMNDDKDRLFEWLSKKSFEALTPVEREEVLAQMTAEEYRELRLTQFVMKAGERQASPVLPDPLVRSGLLAAMRKKNQPALLRLAQYRMPLWQAAAVLLVVLGSFYLFGNRTASNNVVTSLQDTLHEVAEAPAVKYIHDTVYLGKESSREAAQLHSEVKHEINIDNSRQVRAEKTGDSYTAYTPVELPGLHVQRLADKDEYKQGGRSLNDDSLAKQFGFVSM